MFWPSTQSAKTKLRSVVDNQAHPIDTQGWSDTCDAVHGHRNSRELPGEPLWKHQASRKRLLVNKWVRVDLFSPTYFLRDVIVLTKENDVHKHEAAQERRAHHQENLPTSQRCQHKVEGGGRRQVTFNPRMMTNWYTLQYATKSPEVVDSVKHRKKREPEKPSPIDDESLMQFKGSGNESFSRWVEILPASPPMMLVMNESPRMEWNQCEKSCQVPHPDIPSLGAKKRTVASFMKQAEPLDKCDAQNQLPQRVCPP